MRVLVPLIAASMAALLLPASTDAQAPAMPARKAGWWEMTMSMSAPAPMSTTMHMCTDAAIEQRGAALQTQPTIPGVDCTQGPVTRGADGWRYAMTCNMGGMTLAMSGVATGDFENAYRIDTTTRMTPAPTPEMAEMNMVMEGKYLGACPEGRKPGDVDGPGGR